MAENRPGWDPGEHWGVGRWGVAEGEVHVEIVVKVRDDRAVVRKVERDDAGKVLAKYGLNQAGQWVRVPEGAVYSEECRLPVQVYVEDGLG